MAMCNCGCRFACTAVAVVISAIVGVLTAFFQITGVITVTPVFLWVAFGIGVVYLIGLAAAASLGRRTGQNGCVCAAVNALLAGLLGTILFALVLLAVGIVATSVVSAVLVGLLLFFLTLTLTGTACFIRCLFGCGNDATAQNGGDVHLN